MPALLFVFNVVYKSLAKHSPLYVQQGRIEVATSVLSSGRATEAAFKGEAVYEVEFFPHDYSCTGFFSLLYHETAVIETKVHTVL